ncbi:enoyl-CoA hydratase/isomerase family protein [Acuticoccus sp. I52.16.1]|uniref:enoyl-CoA hydratase/isomerase family protein n=1 Tax=Acuticoccus sp. I52.16.1 TaxID=2928472 RepID=UPI001FD256FE|nr:enoyl-CoA hydratase-related protein [Acuticoccus sp. I52.16.1]UOM35555.1 enoyl-CoA hydratase-related protein [Acuticoccus sp. I52.16.1]
MVANGNEAGAGAIVELGEDEDVAALLEQQETAAQIMVTRPTQGTAVVTLNRPDQRNAITFAMWHELADIFDQLAEDESLRSIILTGAGGYFCAGADIKEFATVRATQEGAEEYARRVDRCTEAIAECTKATFAAVSGPAYGGGCGLAVACDFRICDETAVFAIPAARLSIVYGIEETRALYEVVGLTAAKDMLFSGRARDASEALAMGLVSEVSTEDALSAARRRAEALETVAPLSIAGSKLVLEALTKGETAERAERIAVATARATGSEDYREGRTAFVEKRAPRFKGR